VGTKTCANKDERAAEATRHTKIFAPRGAVAVAEHQGFIVYYARALVAGCPELRAG
jgi:hypothetical protein